MNNPQKPYYGTEVFIPDQLIAGDLKIVTGTGVLASGIFPRGSVLGVNATGQYVLSKKSASDGSEKPCAILIESTDASGGAQEIGVYLMGEFNARALNFDASWNIDKLTAALRQCGIFIKDSVSAADPT